MTAVRVGSGTVGKIAGDDLRGSEIFHLRKAESQQAGAELFRIEGGDPWLTQPGYALGAALMAGAHFGRQRFRRIAVIEDHLRGGQSGDEGEGGPDGILGEVRDDAQPGEECGLGGIETGVGETGGQGLPFEIDGGIDQAFGRGDGGFGEALAFPRLGGGVIHFEDAQSGAAWRRGKHRYPAPRPRRRAG